MPELWREVQVGPRRRRSEVAGSPNHMPELRRALPRSRRHDGPEILHGGSPANPGAGGARRLIQSRRRHARAADLSSLFPPETDRLGPGALSDAIRGRTFQEGPVAKFKRDHPIWKGASTPPKKRTYCQPRTNRVQCRLPLRRRWPAGEGRMQSAPRRCRPFESRP
jgi:hypothetical protein